MYVFPFLLSNPLFENKLFNKIATGGAKIIPRIPKKESPIYAENKVSNGCIPRECPTNFGSAICRNNSIIKYSTKIPMAREKFRCNIKITDQGTIIVPTPITGSKSATAIKSANKNAYSTRKIKKPINRITKVMRSNIKYALIYRRKTHLIFSSKRGIFSLSDWGSTDKHALPILVPSAQK